MAAHITASARPATKPSAGIKPCSTAASFAKSLTGKRGTKAHAASASKEAPPGCAPREKRLKNRFYVYMSYFFLLLVEFQFTGTKSQLTFVPYGRCGGKLLVCIIASSINQINISRISISLQNKKLGVHYTQKPLEPKDVERRDAP